MDERMAVQEHVALALSLFELCNHRQSDPAWLDKILAAFAADCEIIDAPSGTTFYGPDGYKRFTRFITESFPEMRTEVTNAFATEDRVVLEGMFREITTGSRNLPTGALPATGSPGEVRVCHVLQFKHGKITSLHSYYDLTTLLEQLDLKSATAQATE
jgi:steroid delta-isomerase-like uncharacterized protein